MRFTSKFMLAATLCGCSALAMAGSNNNTILISKYAELAGMAAGNSYACGLAPAQVEKIKKKHKQDVRKLVVGPMPDFDKRYDEVADKRQKAIVKAWQQGRYKPQADVCAEARRQASR